MADVFAGSSVCNRFFLSRKFSRALEIIFSTLCEAMVRGTTLVVLAIAVAVQICVVAADELPMIGGDPATAPCLPCAPCGELHTAAPLQPSVGFDARSGSVRQEAGTGGVDVCG
jgi:hypothetical protein